jgi:hypothetical protein
MESTIVLVLVVQMLTVDGSPSPRASQRAV